MKRFILFFIFPLVAGMLLSGCGASRNVKVVSNGPLSDYKYFYVTETAGLTSGTGIVLGDNTLTFGAVTDRSANPSDIISGYLIKNGFVKLHELKPELASQTMIVSYGESNRRVNLWGDIIEVSIQFVSADDMDMITVCSAEGQGTTNADHIRKAIKRALGAVLK